MNRFVLEDEDITILDGNEKLTNGGKGSGNFGHAGRPGEVGGSAPQGSTSNLSDFYDKAEALEVEAVEKWSLSDKWTDYKKKLEDKYSEKYPDYEIKIKKAETTAGGSSGPGFIDYIVWGVKKDTEDGDGNSQTVVDNNGNELSPEQQAYFKDSKIRDENGNLLTVYHGSPSGNFDEFDLGLAGANTQSGEKAIFFTDSKSEADEFSYERIRTDSIFFEKRGKKGEVYEGYLNITNPLDLGKAKASDLWKYVKSGFEGFGKEWFERNVEDYRSAKNEQGVKHLLDLQKIKGSEYDGVIARMYATANNNDAKEYIAFESKQFKTSDNKKPTNSPKFRNSVIAENDNDNTNNSVGNLCNAGGNNCDCRDGQTREVNGGPGSGNFGHAGRPGEVGGSAPSGSYTSETTDESYESLREEEDSLGYSLELESGSNIVKYEKELLGTVKTVEKYLDKVPEDMREQMARGLESAKKDLERVIESNKKTLGDDLTAENFEEKYEAYKKSMQTRLDEVRAKISKMRSEKRTIDLVTDSKTPDMDYIGSEKKRIDIARKSIGIFEDDGSLASDWLNGEIGEVKPEIRKAIEKDKELRQACLSQMYYDSNSKADFKDWLKTPVTLRRVQFSDRINKDSGFLSFSQYGEWEGTGQGHNKTFPGDILEVKIKPQDTLGSIPAHEGYAYVEGEVMVPTELVVKALEKKQKNNLDKNVNGGKGSGNFGHAGRPGEVGGSAPQGSSSGARGQRIGVGYGVEGKDVDGKPCSGIITGWLSKTAEVKYGKVGDRDLTVRAKLAEVTDKDGKKYEVPLVAGYIKITMDPTKPTDTPKDRQTEKQKEALEEVFGMINCKSKNYFLQNCSENTAVALRDELRKARDEWGIDLSKFSLDKFNGQVTQARVRWDKTKNGELVEALVLGLSNGLIADGENYINRQKERYNDNWHTAPDIAGLIRHELGHMKAYQIGIDSGVKMFYDNGGFMNGMYWAVCSKIIKAAGVKSYKVSSKQTRADISRYGGKNVEEAVAEAFSNPDYSEFTRKVADIMLDKNYKVEFNQLEGKTLNKFDEKYDPRYDLCDGYPMDEEDWKIVHGKAELKEIQVI